MLAVVVAGRVTQAALTLLLQGSLSMTPEQHCDGTGWNRIPVVFWKGTGGGGHHSVSQSEAATAQRSLSKPGVEVAGTSHKRVEEFKTSLLHDPFINNSQLYFGNKVNKKQTLSKECNS